MSATNGHAKLIEQVKEQRLHLQLAGLKREVAQTRLQENYWSALGMGGWGNPFDPALQASGLGGAGALIAGNKTGRRDGRNLPFLWTEIHYDFSRGQARWLAVENKYAIGILNNLRNYIIRTGFTWEGRPRKQYKQDGTAKAIAGILDTVLSEFSILNSWPQREREILYWAVVDGEQFQRSFAQDDGTTLVREILPEQIGQPPSYAADTHCLYGIETVPHDIETPLAYHATYDGLDFERIPAAEVSHLKRNVPRSVKRGLSDFHSTDESIDGVAKLVNNMVVTGGTQAAIAWIEQFVAASANTAATAAAARRDQNRPNSQDPFTGKTPNRQRYDAGSIPLVGGGKTYLPAPQAVGASVHIQIVQAALRAIGVRWCMPEYMISGDVTQMAELSALASGSPFTVNGECEQDTLKTFFLRILWIAVKNAAKHGRFLVNGHRHTFEEVQALCDIHGTPPKIAIANKGEEFTVDKGLVEAGAMSLQTLRARHDLDNDQEVANLKVEPVPKPGQPGQAEGGSQPAGSPSPGSPGALESLAELRARYRDKVLREGGFSGIDAHGHKWENGQQVKRGEGAAKVQPHSTKTPLQLVSGKRPYKYPGVDVVEKVMRNPDTPTVPIDPHEIRTWQATIDDDRLGRIQGDIRTPIVVVEFEGKYYIEEGNHRAVAAMKAGVRVPAKVIQGVKKPPESVEESFVWRGTLAELRERYGDRVTGEIVEGAAALLESGFSGTVKDKLGREYHYVNGKRTASHPDATAADHAHADARAAAHGARETHQAALAAQAAFEKAKADYKAALAAHREAQMTHQEAGEKRLAAREAEREQKRGKKEEKAKKISAKVGKLRQAINPEDRTLVHDAIATTKGTATPTEKSRGASDDMARWDDVVAALGKKGLAKPAAEKLLTSLNDAELADEMQTGQGLGKPMMRWLRVGTNIREGGFTGIDSHGHKWENGRQVKRGEEGAKKDAPSANKEGATSAPAEKVPSAKAQLAKASAVRVDKTVQRYAEEYNEPRFAKVVGGVSHPDSEPMDVTAKNGDPVEMKTMTVGNDDKLTMNSYAQVRKAVKEKELGRPFHTVVSDDRKVFNANGPGEHGDESERVYYYRRGIAGSARIESLHRCKDEAELLSLMAAPEDKLPPRARRTDAHITGGEWEPFQDEKGKGFRDKKTGKEFRAKK